MAMAAETRTQGRVVLVTGAARRPLSGRGDGRRRHRPRRVRSLGMTPRPAMRWRRSRPTLRMRKPQALPSDRRSIGSAASTASSPMRGSFTRRRCATRTWKTGAGSWTSI